MNSKLFKSLIKCKECKSSYIHFKENNQSKYICNRYKKGKGCSRRVIKEEDITFLVEQHCKIYEVDYMATNEFMKSIIKKIIIDDNTDIFIYYKDDKKSIWTNTTLQF